MIIHLDNLSMESTVASEFKKTAVIALHNLKTRIKAIMDSGILCEDIFTSNTIIKYNSINNEFIEIELFLYLPISQYNDKAEGYFGKIIQAIYLEIQSLQSLPFISTISNSDSYYWAYSKYKIIALPQGEEKYLLNLSDLYHEIGHLIFVQSENFLIGDHLTSMNKYFTKIKEKIKGRNRIGLIRSMDDVMDFWGNSWSEEFACDLIGAYLVGSAYAWTNMKICTISSGTNDVYSYKKMLKEHPPDEARMRAIFRMLELIGIQEEESLKIIDVWNKFLGVTQNIKPEKYDIIFSQVMIESIAQNVFEGCKNLNLKSYPEQIKIHTRPVSKIINEAWGKIRSDPEKFNQWEAEQIENLRS